MGVHPRTGIPLLPLLARLLLQGLVAPMFQMSLWSLSQSLTGTPLCCNKLAQDPRVKTLPKGHPHSDPSL